MLSRLQLKTGQAGGPEMFLFFLDEETIFHPRGKDEISHSKKI